MHHEFPNDLKLRKLSPRHFRRWGVPMCPHKRKKKKTLDLRKLGNIGNLTEMPASPPSANIKLVLVVKNYQKRDFKVFLSGPIFIDFLTLFHKFCPPLSKWKIFFCNLSQSPADFTLLISLSLQNLSQTYNANITWTHFAKVLNETVFCKHQFSYLA